MRSERGFSLLEMLLSVMIIGMITAISVPFFNSFLARNDLDITSQQIAESFRRAQVYARGGKNDSIWSVAVQSTNVILFRGNNFASRNTAFDETIALPGTVTASGLAEVQFAKLTGLPNTTGTVTLTSNANETKTVAINEQGTVNY